MSTKCHGPVSGRSWRMKSGQLATLLSLIDLPGPRMAATPAFALPERCNSAICATISWPSGPQANVDFAEAASRISAMQQAKRLVIVIHRRTRRGFVQSPASWRAQREHGRVSHCHGGDPTNGFGFGAGEVSRHAAQT